MKLLSCGIKIWRECLLGNDVIINFALYNWISALSFVTFLPSYQKNLIKKIDLKRGVCLTKLIMKNTTTTNALQNHNHFALSLSPKLIDIPSHNSKKEILFQVFLVACF